MIHLLLIAAAFVIPPDYEDCESIKDGLFTMTLEVEDQPSVITHIERKGDIQYERSEQLGSEHKFRVEWLDDCTYTLKLIDTIKNDNGMEYPADMILTVEVTEVYPDYYLTVSTSNIADFRIEGRVERMK